jgi:hypothetical protein
MRLTVSSSQIAHLRAAVDGLPGEDAGEVR